MEIRAWVTIFFFFFWPQDEVSPKRFALLFLANFGKDTEQKESTRDAEAPAADCV